MKEILSLIRLKRKSRRVDVFMGWGGTKVLQPVAVAEVVEKWQH